MAVKKTRIAETAPPPNVLLYVGLVVCSRFSRCTLQTRCFVVWTSGFRTLCGLNTPNNKAPKADLGLYIMGGLVRSVVGRWRLHCYTIKSHCAGLFLALWRDRMCFICNFTAEIDLSKRCFMLQTDSLDDLLYSCSLNPQWMYERHPRVPCYTRWMENFISLRCCTCRRASTHSQYRQMRAEYCGLSGKMK